MDYTDQLIAESRNNVHYKAKYTHQCRCWGKCFDELKEKSKEEVYYGPWRSFLVVEKGIWTIITCPVCGYTNFWSVGDGDALF